MWLPIILKMCVPWNNLRKNNVALLNGVALLVVAVGMIAGSIFENTIVVSCLAAWGTVLKGWNDFKKFPVKVNRGQFAYTTYTKILTELRTYTQGIPFKEDSFLVKMQTTPSPISHKPSPINACKSITVVFITWAWWVCLLHPDVLVHQCWMHHTVS